VGRKTYWAETIGYKVLKVLPGANTHLKRTLKERNSYPRGDINPELEGYNAALHNQSRDIKWGEKSSD